jgi:DNA-binding Lrp family transcriptional regulator
MTKNATGLPDPKDVKILRVLKKDARATIRHISKSTGIRPSTVHQRLVNLFKDGTIKRFTIDLDEKMVGLNFTVYMLIAGKLDKYLDTEIIGNQNLVELSGITGEFDLIMKLKFHDMDEFNRFLITFRERYADKVTKTVTMVQTISLKDEGPPI